MAAVASFAALATLLVVLDVVVDAPAEAAALGADAARGADPLEPVAVVVPAT